MQVSEPKYKLIALKIAMKIVDGTYEEGSKIYARSAISSQYNVSSETARRAIAVLVDLGIVNAVKGSGVNVVSSEKAFAFITKYNQARTVDESFQEIQDTIKTSLNTLTDSVSDLQNLFLNVRKSQEFPIFTPFQIKVVESCKHIGKSIADIRLWEHTNATVVALKRDGVVVMSPGPHAILQTADIFYFVGEEESYSRVMSFLY